MTKSKLAGGEAWSTLAKLSSRAGRSGSFPPRKITETSRDVSYVYVGKRPARIAYLTFYAPLPTVHLKPKIQGPSE